MLRRGILVFLSLVLLAPAVCRTAEETSGQTSDSVLLSNMSMWQGHQYLKEGRPDLAAEAFMKAAGYARTSPRPHFMLARLHLRRSLMDAVLEFATGVKLLLADFSYQSFFLSNLLLVVLLAIGIAAYVAIISVLARYARTIWFSIFLTFSPAFGERSLKIMVASSIAAFFILLSGLSLIAMVTWAAIIGSALAWRYATASDRRVMVGFLVFLVAFVPIFDLTARVVSTQHSGSPTKIVALAGDTTEERLARVAKTNKVLAENDPIGEFMRGLLYLRTGEDALAIEHFNLASKFTRNNAAILNNIGIAFHNLGSYREAQKAFQEALRYGPREALIHYNYSQTLNSLLYYDVAQEEIAKASSLDFDLTRSLVTAKDRPTMIPMTLATEVLWELAMQPENKMLKSPYHPTESGWPGLLVLALLAASAFMLMRGAKLPARCDICESVIGSQIVKRKRRDVLCPECRAIKQANADDNDALEKELEQRVTRLETRKGILTLVLGFLAPGSTYHLLGSKIKGFLLSVVIFTLLIVMVTGGGPMKPVPQLDLGRSFGWGIIVFVAVYALYAWRSVLLVVRSSREE